MTLVRQDPMDRFFRFLEWQGDCLVWTGAVSNKGYGLFSMPRGVDYWRKVLAHRWIWEQTEGEIPPGMTIDHVQARGCTTRACQWVGHMEVVTVQTNLSRRVYRVSR